MRFRRKRSSTRRLCTKVLRGLGPLMGLLALSAPVFAEPLASWGSAANATERRLTTGLASDSARFFHPLVTLLRLVNAGSASGNHIQPHPSDMLGWDALRGTSLRGSIWMVRDRWMSRPPELHPSFVSLLRC
jgi:hypothetical protein